MINISEPFIGSTIRLQPITWSSLTPCVRMEMYGCLANPGLQTSIAMKVLHCTNLFHV